MSHNVKHIMETNPETIRPETTLQQAAMKMRDIDCGFLPVGQDDNIRGIITDRDIVIRAIAEGKDPNKEKVSDYMTNQVCSCSEEDTLDQAAEKMLNNNVSRLVVMNSSGNITGVLSFGRILRANDDRKAVDQVVECAKAA